MSCKFCYKLGDNDRNKEVNWEVRTCYTDQNIENYNNEFSEWDGKNRIIKSQGFDLTAYKYENEVKISVGYNMTTNDGLIINTFSEAITWSFCPFCGKQISSKVRIPKYEHQFLIEDEEFDDEEIIGKIKEEEYVDK